MTHLTPDPWTLPSGSPTFGVPTPEDPSPVRPAAYALIRRDDGALAAVGHRGDLFLPGGGAEAGESPEETVRREVREELGVGVSRLSRIGGAIEYFVSDTERFELRAVFYEATLMKEPCGEGEHQLHWLEPHTPASPFPYRSHAWIVSRAP